MVKFLIWASICLLVAGCGAPIFKSDEERFNSEPEIREALSPYLDQWATTPPEETSDQRDEVASQLDRVAISLIPTDRTTLVGDPIYVVDIRVDLWADWSRGLFYVIDGVEVSENIHLTVRRIDEHWFAYNRTE